MELLGTKPLNFFNKQSTLTRTMIKMTRKKVVKKGKKKVVKKGKTTDKNSRNKGEHTPLAEVEVAIRSTGGFISQAAKVLGITRQSVWDRIERHPQLQEALKDVKETYLDLAESQLIRAMKLGERWAIKYYLNTQGKDRGYVERHEHTGKEGKPLPLTLKIERAERVKELDVKK